MAKLNKFYKNKGFWAVLFGTVGGLLAGDAGAITGIAQIFHLIFG